MIPENKVAEIMETAQIEEVVSDFVNLKKRGSNYVSNCPFHNERTPSFSVSPSKGIFKCFGCGKAGNSVGFVMEHENMSYPEALRYLGKKYNIEIEEVQIEGFSEEQKEREGLFIINNFANEHFQHNLFETSEGKNVGLSYFKERGFRDETIKKFQLGYSLENAQEIIKEARSKGFRLGFLAKLGLIKQSNGRDFAFFRGRVQFPIHNLSGKVIAFAGRTLRNDKKIPKYINSPESDIYNKSKVLYGIYFARNAIRKYDECYLVEGYTDMISLYQSGIENVVASSGTSLTTDQIRLIKRYTNNITILYDGDVAGIKAALRGIDMIIEQGLNVKIVLLPEGEDPDSFIKKNGKNGFETFVKEEIKDFVFFKAGLLLKEVGDDPIKKSELIRSIIQTLTKVQDPIKRSLYVKECSKLLDVSERMIINETNKLKWSSIKKDQETKDRQQKRSTSSAPSPVQAPDFELQQTTDKAANVTLNLSKNILQVGITVCEREIAKLLLEFGRNELEIGVPAATFILHEVESFPFEEKNCRRVIDLFKTHLEAENKVLDSDFFISNQDKQLSQLAANLICSDYELSENWEKMHGIFITKETLKFKEKTYNVLNFYKLRRVMKMIDENLKNIKEGQSIEEMMDFQRTHLQLLTYQKELSKLLNIVLLR